MSVTTTTPTDAITNGQAFGNAAETSSGLRIDFTAKGYLQPGFTLRYATADEALTRANADWGRLFDQLQIAAHGRGIKLVTEQNL